MTNNVRISQSNIACSSTMMMCGMMMRRLLGVGGMSM